MTSKTLTDQTSVTVLFKNRTDPGLSVGHASEDEQIRRGQHFSQMPGK